MQGPDRHYRSVNGIGMQRTSRLLVTVSTSTFFVGLSRAAQRVIFTQCSQRGGHTDIADLYAVLEQAGIAVHDF
jgi:hypothetical protein